MAEESKPLCVIDMFPFSAGEHEYSKQLYIGLMGVACRFLAELPQGYCGEVVVAALGEAYEAARRAMLNGNYAAAALNPPPEGSTSN
jgi:hypothetical protein